MNLLIVDDDIYTVRALVSRVQWKNIGIEKVFTAFNVDKAKEILKGENISIVLTDIEMPGKSGLDLIQWCTEENIKPVSLCLTCHAEFSYAQKAIALGFHDFYVKPINFNELQLKISQIVKEIQVEEKKKIQMQEGKLWKNTRKLAQNKFWHDLILGRLGKNPELIYERAEQCQAQYQFDIQYSLFMIKVKNFWYAKQEWNNYELLEYALMNIATEVLDETLQEGLVAENQCLWLVGSEKQADLWKEQICEYMQTVENILKISLITYKGHPVYGEAISAQRKKLIEYERQNVTQDLKLIDIDAKENAVTPNLERKIFLDLHLLLSQKKYNLFLEECERILDGFSHTINKTALTDLIHNLWQIFSVTLWKENLMMMDFMDRELTELYDMVYESTEPVKVWIKMALKKIAQLREQGSQDNIVIEEAKKYIADHLTSKIKRKDIADAVHVSQDYLSRLFTKTTGVPLSQYIIENKVGLAIQMIEKDNLSVGEIAQKLGYDNFSYFSNLFKKVLGLTPSEYKKNYQNSDQ